MNILDHLSNLLSVDASFLRKYISTCPHRYKVYSIPKRNGNGSRIIAQPAKELKQLQKILCKESLSDLPVHEVCKAYKKNTNIKDNALVHVNNRYLLKMDFKDFFPSITPSDLVMHIEEHLKYDLTDEDKSAIGNIFFYMPRKDTSLRLSVGAPTSPFISNSIMYGFDLLIKEECDKQGILYSRYADDLAFSTNEKNVLFKFEGFVKSTLESLKYPKIAINPEKTVFLSRKCNMHVTGLVLSNEGKVSLGRKKKRHIKSLVHKYVNGVITPEEKSYLSGFLSYCNSVEPEFITRLEKKYGLDIIKSITL